MARQHNNESGIDWHCRLRSLHLRAWRINVPEDRNLDTHLIAKYIDHLCTHKIFEEVIKLNPLTFEDALTAVQAQESFLLRQKGRVESHREHHSRDHPRAYAIGSIAGSNEVNRGYRRPPAGPLMGVATGPTGGAPMGAMAMGGNYRGASGGFGSRGLRNDGRADNGNVNGYPPRKMDTIQGGRTEGGMDATLNQACWWCGITGHRKSECRKYAADMRRGATPALSSRASTSHMPGNFPGGNARKGSWDSPPGKRGINQMEYAPEDLHAQEAGNE